MYKKLSVLSLLAPLMLAGCGSADLGGAAPEENTDITPPQLTTVFVNGKPMAGGTLGDVYLDSVAFEFDEALDVSLLTTAGVLVAGETTPALDGTWSYNATSYTLTFTASNPILGYDKNGVIRIYTDKIADLAGNLYADNGTNIVDRASYATPKTLNVTVKMNGLLANNTPSVKVENLALLNSESLTFSSSTNSQTFTGVSIINGQQYKVSLSNNKQVCSGGGTLLMGTNAPTIEFTCSDVTPYFDNAPYWNDRLQSSADLNNATIAGCSNSLAGCFHGGVYRRFETNMTNSCVGISVTDKLGAFNWSCQETGNGSIVAVSTGFASGKGLRDLIKVTLVSNPVESSSVQWLANTVQISRNGSALVNSTSSVWWPNSISLTSSGSLSSDHHVYVYSNYLGISQLSTPTVAATSNISLVVPHNSALYGNVKLDGNHSNLWVEGEFYGTNTNEPAVLLSNTTNAILHNVRVHSSKGVGVELTTTTTTRSSGSLDITGATSHGLKIKGGLLNALDTVTLTKNGGDGLLIQGYKDDGQPDNSLENIHADNNDGHGIELQDARNNHIILSSATSNVGDGLHFSKAATSIQGSSFNYIGQFSSLNNSGDGINATSSQLLNSINGAFVALNKGKGINISNSFSYDALRVERSKVGYNASGDCSVDATSTCPTGVTTDSGTDLSTVFAGATGTTLPSSQALLQMYNLNLAQQRWVESSIDLVNGVGSGACRVNGNNSCILFDWSLLGNTATNTFPGVDSGTTPTYFAYALNTSQVALEQEYQPAKADRLNDGIGNGDAFCYTNTAGPVESCSDAPTIGHYQLPAP